MRWSKARRVARAALRLTQYLPIALTGFRCGMPSTVDLELTNRCNLRCPMCWFHGEAGSGGTDRQAELSTADVLRLVQQLSRYRTITNLYLGGGEPFSRRDFREILQSIKRQGLPVSFTTNGTLINAETVRDLVEWQIERVNFSIDGPRDLHDAVRGPGVFAKATGAIRSLSHYKKTRAATRPAIYVNVTVTACSPGQISKSIQAIREATDDGVDVYQIHHLWFVTNSELAAHQRSVHRLLGVEAPGAACHALSGGSVPDPGALAADIQPLRQLPDVRCFPDLNFAEIVSYYSDGGRCSRRCVAPLHAVVVKPNGDVRFCPDEWIDDYLLGNVRREDLARIWNSRRARRFRAVLFLKRQFTGCKRCSWMYSF